MRYEALPVSAVKPRIGALTPTKTPDPWANLDLSSASAAVERAVQAGKKPEPVAAHEQSRAAFERSAGEIAALKRDGLVVPPSMLEERDRLYGAFRSDLKALAGREPRAAWGIAEAVEKERPDAAQGLRREIAADIVVSAKPLRQHQAETGARTLWTAAPNGFSRSPQHNASGSRAASRSRAESCRCSTRTGARSILP